MEPVSPTKDLTLTQILTPSRLPHLRSQPSGLSSPSTIPKDWPRPKDSDTTKRAGDWVKAQAARRNVKLDEELRSGAGMEIVGAGMYEGGVESRSLYLDGYSDLAVWMGTGGTSRPSLAESPRSSPAKRKSYAPMMPMGMPM